VYSWDWGPPRLIKGKGGFERKKWHRPKVPYGREKPPTQVQRVNKIQSKQAERGKTHQHGGRKTSALREASIMARKRKSF